VLIQIDPSMYLLISLLAGTEVYMTAKQRERLKAAENPEQVSVFDTPDEPPD
jgi:hypothetical protein